MINHAYEMGVSMIELQVKVTNKHAFKLYIKYGFKIVKQIYRYYNDDSDAYLMQHSCR